MSTAFTDEEVQLALAIVGQLDPEPYVDKAKALIYKVKGASK